MTYSPFFKTLPIKKAFMKNFYWRLSSMSWVFKRQIKVFKISSKRKRRAPFRDNSMIPLRCCVPSDGKSSWSFLYLFLYWKHFYLLTSHLSNLITIMYRFSYVVYSFSYYFLRNFSPILLLAWPNNVTQDVTPNGRWSWSMLLL